MNNQIILECRKINKTYQDADLFADVIRDLDLRVKEADSVCILGSSGSGKSTLLHLLGGLDTPTSGNIILMGNNLNQLNQTALGNLRNQYLGFVYQFHHLLPEFSALENVMMPLFIAKKSPKEAEELAAAMLEKVGLSNRLQHRPSELSGGEKQRVAVARALVTQPKCILADEPTGNLDKKNAYKVIELMMELKEELKTALLIVTHDEDLCSHFAQTLHMDDGRLNR